MTLRYQLEAEEGRRACVYKDSLGLWTIGVGRLVDSSKPGAGLRPAEIDLLLANDIDEKTDEVRAALPWIDSLDEPRRAVLIGMAFQMGTRGLLGFKNTLAMVKARDYEGAARGMLASKWAQQTPNRAHRLAEQMRTGQWQMAKG